MSALNERPLVVLVDDDPQVLFALKRSLRHEPYRLLVTNRPEEAIRWVESNDVSAVVSDERMPDMSGTELLGRVRTCSPSTYRIICTAYGGESSWRLWAQDATEYLIAKPWDDRELKTVLRESLKEREWEDRFGDGDFERKGAKDRA